MSSARLPGKTLADVGGEPMLDLLLKRVRRATSLDRVLVATSSDPGDDLIAEVAMRAGVEVARGPRDDVLARFVGAIEGVEEPVVRITADCPLIDPLVVDRVVELYESSPTVVYASNIGERTFPDGLDVEAVDPDALREVASSVADPGAREHVTLAIRADPDRWPSVNLRHDENLGEVRWTVDEDADLEFVRRVVERLGKRRYGAGLEEVRAAVRAAPSLAAFGGVRRA